MSALLPGVDAPSLRQVCEQDLPLDALRVATRAALLASNHMMLPEAQTIVDGLHPVFGDYIAVAMARAVVATAGRRHAEALAMLERLSAQNPEVDAILCACATLRKELGVAGWRVLAERVLKRGTDPQASALAAEMLEVHKPNATNAVAGLAARAGLRFA